MFHWFQASITKLLQPQKNKSKLCIYYTCYFWVTDANVRVYYYDNPRKQQKKEEHLQWVLALSGPQNI